MYTHVSKCKNNKIKKERKLQEKSAKLPIRITADFQQKLMAKKA
jgi:hypothetical protein